MWMVAAYILAVVALFILLIRFALWRIKQTRTKQSLYSDASQNGYVASTFDSSLIGKKGVVLTDLKPGGHILVEGKKVQALSEEGYLAKGTEVLVVGGQEESVLVTHLTQKSEPK
jgi:membrane-bound serine protease (ClpP class)